MEQKKLRKLQLVEFDILCDVVDICEKYNIKYFLIGGTLLGAVRHGGFIPWDDDIDIGMMREEYNKFLDICKTKLSNKYFLQNKNTDKRVMPSFTKIRKLGTLFFEKSTKKSNINKGIFIDIFPLDNIPLRDSLRMKIEYLIFKFFRFLSLYKNNYRGFRTWYNRLFISLFCFIPFSFINYLSIFFMTRHNNRDTKFVTSYSSGYGYKKQRMNKLEIYGEGVSIMFEGREFNAPSNYRNYLIQLYGNYMEIPSKDKRVAHLELNNVVFDSLNS